MVDFLRKHFQREGLSILLASFLAAVTAVIQNGGFYLILLLLSFGVILCILISRQSWEEKSESRLDNLDKRFVEMSAIRVGAAQTLLGNKQDNGAIEDVIDFFEDIGFHLKKYRVEEEEVYHRFSHYILLYYEAAHERVIERLSREGDTWEHVPYLYDVILKIKNKKIPSYPKKLSPEKLREFLEIEANLI